MLENIRLALRGIWSHKLRSFLTMLGVIIGIASIIAIVSIVEGTNQKLSTSLVGSGNNVVTVSVHEESWPADFSGGIPTGVPRVAPELFSEVQRVEGVVSATKYVSRNLYHAAFYKNTPLNNGQLRGVDEHYFNTVEYDLTLGRDFREEEFKNGKKVAIIDTGAMDTLFNGENPVGQAIELMEEPFVVVGVVKNRNKTEREYESINDYYMYGEGMRSGEVFVPLNTWPIICQYDEPETVGLKVETTEQMKTAADTAAEILNGNVMSENLRYGNDNDASGDELETLTNAIQLMLVGIASLSLLVGGIGVMNIMLVSVTERTAEIGLKKALGAKRRTILWQFLTESAVLTSVGGVLGILVGVILAKGISMLTGLAFGISVEWILISVLFSMGIGILFGAMPARRASKLNPIDALRRD